MSTDESTKTANEATRAKQRKVLELFVQRLQEGDNPLPADLMAQLADELTTRIAQESIKKAWANQENTPPTPWRGEAARTARRNRGRHVAEIQILHSANQTLQSLDPTTQEEIALEIDALAFDPSPRGTTPLFHNTDHVHLPIGNHKLIYAIQNNTITIVAISPDPSA